MRPLQCAQQLDLRVISIHVPRAGCDPATLSTRSPCPHFNPRTPCGVRPSAIILSRSCPRYFNPRTPCGVRLQADAVRRGFQQISIHVPRAGCDRIHPGIPPPIFQSTYPVRGATTQVACGGRFIAISIHVPRAGCDGKFDDFNPLNLHKRYKRVLDRPKSTSEQGKNKAKLAYIHVFTVFLGGAKVPELSARFYFAPNTVRLSARPWRHSPLWHRNARCGCDTYPQGSKSADCLRIHP